MAGFNVDDVVCMVFICGGWTWAMFVTMAERWFKWVKPVVPGLNFVQTYAEDNGFDPI